MKTSYRKIDNDKYEVYLIDDADDTEVYLGCVYLDIMKKAKWYVEPYFDVLLEDYEITLDAYDTSVAAGRSLVAAYINYKNYNIQLGLDFSELFMGTD